MGECVGGVEPETVTLWRECWKGQEPGEWWAEQTYASGNDLLVEEQKFVPLSALRLVEEELRQAREERDAARAQCNRAREDFNWMNEWRARVESEEIRLTAWLDSIAVTDLSGIAHSESVGDPYDEALVSVAAGYRGMARAALGGERLGGVSALSPVQGEHEQDRCPKCGAHEMSGYDCPSPPCGLGEHEQDGEARIYVTASEARLIGDAYFTGSPDALDRAHDVIARLADAADGRGELRDHNEKENTMSTTSADTSNNDLIGETDARIWAGRFTDMVKDNVIDPGDEDTMLTWFACAIESGRMTVQGEHEQDGEDAGGPSLDEVYAERNKVVLAFAALVKEQGWDVGLAVDPDSPDWPVLMIETDAGQVSWHFQAGELPPGLPLFAGKWDGHSTPEKYDRLAELVRSAFGLGEIAQDGDTEETT